MSISRNLDSITLSFITHLAELESPPRELTNSTRFTISRVRSGASTLLHCHVTQSVCVIVNLRGGIVPTGGRERRAREGVGEVGGG